MSRSNISSMRRPCLQHFLCDWPSRLNLKKAHSKEKLFYKPYQVLPCPVQVCGCGSLHAAVRRCVSLLLGLPLSHHGPLPKVGIIANTPRPHSLCLYVMAIDKLVTSSCEYTMDIPEMSHTSEEAKDLVR